ncbi:lysylphosphatidylglycerol synthase transmembrane domain-containing protein [Halomicrobium urmianum]|uniref:lysylphosphatidylglycerol synthase transmembrane domain-containing protein n=1 Tax=Halomicrobium urmianum TaxID=1586233 RepID=UPI001CD9DDA4|nr:flippase-like domain-containing protein [Halomicrobium urmianum]
MTEEPSGLLALLDRKTVAQIALGFLVAVVVLGLFAVGIGVDEIRAALSGAQLEWLVLGCLSTLLCLTAWGKAWQIVLRVAGVEESFRRLAVTYYAATFANYVTPLGQAGGEPFIAYVLSRDTDASYEGALASVVTADLLNMLPFVTFSGVGFAALVYQSSLPAALEPLAAGLMGLAVGVPALAAVGWRYRFSLGRLALRLAAPVARRTKRLGLEGLRERLRELNDAFQRIAQDRRALVSVLAFAYLGWLFFALPLYFAGLTIGRDLDLLLVLFIVPASTLAGLVPSPGGLGGVEAAMIALLVGLLGVTTATGYAVALIYRLASYWFALGLGGVAALYVIARN